ncbi:NAD(P)-dependent oxidoreductase [Opitutales bacterium ASA1]|uniref:NAD(P)-dependent oxidoreductase n=1 Tax=Congregicoccus parvus TaxID=3081749 RepID=UPI002B322CC2|nr:NAD(P)-dependent oxidoreductase [Opitutales bacterium ASA1]
MSQNTSSIAFVGTGVMGRSMAGHLLAAGHRLHVHNRTPARAQALVDAGAVWHDSPGSAAAEAEFVITIVGYPSDVEVVYLGEGGIVERARRGAVLIDMTTSSPALARRIAEAASARGLSALDAPVSGGDVGAKEARLVVMVGGEAAAFERARPLFERMGKTIALLGGPGAGQHCKMSNQIAIAAGMLGWAEAVVYAQKAGLDASRVLEVIGGGAAGSWSLSNLAPRALAGNFAPGFYVKHFLKDMRIAIESAEEMRLDLPGLALARRLYDRVAAAGWEDCGTQAILRLYAAQAGRADDVS